MELEEPSSTESTDTGAASLISDQLPQMAARLAALETLISLQVKDLSFEDYMREILLVFLKAVKSEAGSILEVNSEEGVLFFRTAVGFSSDQVVHFSVPIGKGIAGHVAESRTPFVVSDFNENKVHLKSIQDAVGFQAKNMIAMPILIRGKVFAVLELLDRVGESSYSESDVELLTHCCAYASKVIEMRLMLAWSLQNRTEVRRDAA